MARLNDPPAPPAESLDALKRRFIRQNREIARVNSTQSQRIRNLETEISRLLAENIAVREQAIAAAAEVERLRVVSRLGRDVLELKARLESKLFEVGALVEELGGLPERAARRSSFRRRRSGIVQDSVGSPNDRDWRKKQAVSELGLGERDGQDGRLPAILEDKYYPRRTLEHDELHILTAVANVGDEDTESPDLGPPPVAHFEVADPIAFDSAKSPKRVSGGIVTSDDDMVPLPRNLETRRKRRTSSLLHDMSRLEEGETEPDQNNEERSISAVRSSGKRKFDASQMGLSATQAPQNDGFEYSRKETGVSGRPRPSRFAARPADRVQNSQIENQPVSPEKTSQARRALAPKSTNSPTKKTIGGLHEKKDNSKDDKFTHTKSSTRRPVAPSISLVTAIDALEVEHDVGKPTFAPKTPAPELGDIISPPSSAVDTAQKPQSIEAAITNSVEDVLNGSIGRGSRRARAAVSYAEPNLRDKMRRPDKKLVGAIEGISKPSASSGGEQGHETLREPNAEPVQSTHTIRTIKFEPESKSTGDEKWREFSETEREVKNEIASPLQDKEKAYHIKPADLRKKRTFSESEGTKSKAKATASGIEEDLNKAASRLSIYDPPLSSPASATTKDKESSETLIARPHRDPLTTTVRKATDRPVTAITASSSTSSLTTIRSRRHSVHPSSDTAVAPSSGISTTRSSSSLSTRETGKENINLAPSRLKRASSVQTMSQTQTQQQQHTGSAVQQQGKGTGLGPPGDRTLGSRRRSMMV